MTASFASEQPVPQWFRYCLYLSAIISFLGAVFFSPPIYFTRGVKIGLPADAAPFCLWIITAWIFILGVGYAYVAWTNQMQKFFLAVSAAFKLSIGVILLVYWFNGTLPWISGLVGSSDVFFGLVFIFVLLQASTSRRSQPSVT
ncbi:MAG: hypothetical protein SFY66_00310 [Oculatellaceae cyanobacterium bins.114]|nr:hypothetical protein [Oculatellaceae cyanobacterium bins.114]